MKRLKVLFLSNNTSGMYLFRKEVIEEISKIAETYLYAPQGARIIDWKNLNCEYIPAHFDAKSINPIKDIKLIYSYKKLIGLIRPNICFTYTIKPNAYAGIICSRLGIPYIANVTGIGDAVENGGVLGIIAQTLYKAGLRKAECVFFQNSRDQNLFINRKICKQKSRVIPGSGVNLKEYSIAPYTKATGITRFLFVGRIKKDKGINELLSAIKILNASSQSCVLDIVGHFEEEDYKEQVEYLSKRGLVVFHGLQKNVHPFYENCHCVVLPSYHEGTSNVLLEGAATGRPIISTRIPGCKETFDEGITGFGCNVKDVKSLVETMKKFLSLSQEEKEAMGIAGRQKMEREFDRNVVIKAYLDEMHKALEKGKDEHQNGYL